MNRADRKGNEMPPVKADSANHIDRTERFETRLYGKKHENVVIRGCARQQNKTNSKSDSVEMDKKQTSRDYDGKLILIKLSIYSMSEQ